MHTLPDAHLLALTDTSVVVGPRGVRRAGDQPPATGEVRLAPLEGETRPGERFCARFGLASPLLSGAMAHGISGPELVADVSSGGMLGFLGTAGRPPVWLLQSARDLAGRGCHLWGANLIHQPGASQQEEAIARTLVESRAPWVSLSAFVQVTPRMVGLAFQGARKEGGHLVRARELLLKTSLPAFARAALGPPSKELVLAAAAKGWLTREEALLAITHPVVDCVVLEGDSAGHTDGRQWTELFDALQAGREQLLQARRGREMWIGVAGGFGEPGEVARAWEAGADFVLVGSVMQSTRQAEQGELAKDMLVAAAPDDVGMAPAADMYEFGARVQVLTRGTSFARRANLLDTWGRAAANGLPDGEELEPSYEAITGESPQTAWEATQAFWAIRDPEVLVRAEDSRRLRAALLVRRYLGLSSRWARRGDVDRQDDFQIWCGPAQGRLNVWLTGCHLQDWRQRGARQTLELLWRASLTTVRVWSLARYELPLPAVCPVAWLMEDDDAR